MMQILPEDLGVRRCVGVVRMRMKTTPVTTPFPDAATVSDAVGKARLNPLYRFWTRGVNLPDAARAHIMQGAGGIIGGSLGGFCGGSSGFLVGGVAAASSNEPIAGAVMLTLWLGMWTTGFNMPGWVVRSACRKPIQTEEVETWLNQNIEDPLEKEFLRLVRDALAQPVASPTIEKNLRDGIRALADAIDQVPRSSRLIPNGISYREEITEVRTLLESETDPVIIESHQRRIAALEQSVRNLERNSRIARRADALRDELMAQIGALRLGLSSLGTEAGDNLPGLTSLADSVRRVAAEAGALADAREELDVALATKPGLSRPLTTAPRTESEPQTVRVGRRG
jgi:hypothetical protein